MMPAEMPASSISKQKKNKQRGFNGNLNLGYSQGRYPKSNNSFSFNYRDGKINTYLNYSFTYNQFYNDLYALRTYFDDAGNTIAKLDQPTTFKGHFLNHTIRTGIDYSLSANTTLGLGLTGIWSARTGDNIAEATWLGAGEQVDSSLTTTSITDYHLSNGGLTLSLRHNFTAGKELTVDLDGLAYDIHNNQQFVNTYNTRIYFFFF